MFTATVTCELIAKLQIYIFSDINDSAKNDKNFAEMMDHYLGTQHIIDDLPNWKTYMKNAFNIHFSKKTFFPPMPK